MTFSGNNGVGPTGVSPTGPNPNAGQVIGSGGTPNPAPFYQASFESVLAAVSRGEISLNMLVANGSQFGGAVAGQQAGNPTLLQAISQGNGQNGTNGLGAPAAGGGTVNTSFASLNAAPGSFDNGKSMGGTQTIDAKQVMNDSTVQLSSPINYGGN